ncbi:MAG: hypothetical protein LBI65_02625 [Candidatus Symbiothrix sp.]|nr:hypothetical protein [Candidatus Symbiothrix sp.]
MLPGCICITIQAIQKWLSISGRISRIRRISRCTTPGISTRVQPSGKYISLPKIR